jgi:DNA-binding CsgD family transcriptional regulator/tetratricopeptide (TPR) repeat protein
MLLRSGTALLVVPHWNVAGRPYRSGAALVGRDDELERIGRVLPGGAGEPAVGLIVDGDAGVGKTSLVRAACARLRTGTLVLSGACLPLTSLTVPFLPLRGAFRDASRAAARAREHLPALPDLDGSPARVPLAVDEWLDEVADTRPVVLSIDDLHWADEASLDVLQYLIAGPADRQVTVMATTRSEESTPGRLVDRWLAGVRRMPRVEFLTLGPLDRVATGLLIEDLMGAAPDQSLVEDVYRHSRGHPYLTELAVAGLPAGTRHLPADLPTSLTSAVLESARRLPSDAQELLGILAIGGAPSDVTTLTAVIAVSPVPTRLRAHAGALQRLLAPAVRSGALVAAPDGSHWFRHPLTAEVLERELPAGIRAGWHAAFAEHEAALLRDRPSSDLVVHVADHYARSGRTAEAYRWALHAAHCARDTGAHGEELRLLSRAERLHPAVPDASPPLLDLLHREQAAAKAAGVLEKELALLARLLELETSDPLVRAELLVRRMYVRAACQLTARTPAAAQEAIDLSSTAPQSWQHAYALAAWAEAQSLSAAETAKPAALEAVRIARASGHPLALAWALIASASSVPDQDRPEEAPRVAQEAMEAALEAGDHLAFNHAADIEATSLEVWASRTYAESLRRRRIQLGASVAPHVYVAWLAHAEAAAWLAVGDWSGCRAALRFCFGADPGLYVDAGARLTAARLAALQGRPAEAVAHLTRAEELLPSRRLSLSFGMDAVRAEVYLAAGDPRAAFAAASDGLVEPNMVALMSEWLLPLAARALADQAEAARDTGHDVGPIEAAVEDLVSAHPEVLVDPVNADTELARLQHAAFSLLYQAEISRARADQGAPDDWRRSADAFAAAGLPWEEAYACLRAAESLLLRTRGGAQPGASAVTRRGIRLAGRLGAASISSRLRELAALAHLRLDDVAPKVSDVAYPGIPGLTEREREILRYVVAGRTYAEIASDLVISEKTVSSHISSLLRKTGATNRIHLARLAAAADTRPPARQ